MGNFRFYRRLTIFPGLSVNLSKSGPSLTVGVRGAHVTFGRNGVRRTIGIPGTGLYYTSQRGYHTGFHSAHTETPIDGPTQAKANRLAGLVLLTIIVAVALLAGVIIGALFAHT